MTRRIRKLMILSALLLQWSWWRLVELGFVIFFGSPQGGDSSFCVLRPTGKENTAEGVDV